MTKTIDHLRSSDLIIIGFFLRLATE